MVQLAKESIMGNYIKGFWKSIIMRSTCPLMSRTVCMSSIKPESCVSHDLPFRKPCCWSARIPNFSKRFIIWPWIMCSSNLQTIDAKETGLYVVEIDHLFYIPGLHSQYNTPVWGLDTCRNGLLKDLLKHWSYTDRTGFEHSSLDFIWSWSFARVDFQH